MSTLDCGHPTPEPVTSGPTGYAMRNARRICYPCADVYEREALTRERKIGAYLSGAGPYTITTWTGGLLMRVTSVTKAHVGFRDVTGRRPERWYLQATDVHGQSWKGTSPGPGMYARMRRAA